MIRMSFPPISNRQSFSDVVEITDDDDDTPLDLTGCTIQMALRPTVGFISDYGSNFGSWDTSVDGGSLLATTADSSITILDTGVFQFAFTLTQIETLCPGIYDVGMNITRDSETVQLILGQLPVLDGVVPQ